MPQLTMPSRPSERRPNLNPRVCLDQFDCLKFTYSNLNDVQKSEAADISQNPILTAAIRRLSESIAILHNLRERQCKIIDCYIKAYAMIYAQAQHLVGSCSVASKDFQFYLATAAEYARLKLAFYHQVRATLALNRRAEFKRIVSQHYYTERGRHMVNLAGQKHFEFLDPLHRCHSDVQQEWHQFVKAQESAKQNPYDHLDEFLIGLEFAKEAGLSSARKYNSEADQFYYRLKYDGDEKTHGSDRRIYALYHERGPAAGARYAHYVDSIGDPLAALGCQWLPYTSSGQSDQGRIALDDLTGGDIYVMDSNYKLYTFQPTEFHSFLLGGKAVMSAGVIVAQEGKVVAIDNKSGHYRPTWRNLHQAVCELAFHDVFAHDAFVSLTVGKIGTGMYFSVDDFIQLGNRGFKFNDTVAVVRHQYNRYQGQLPVPQRLESVACRYDKKWPIDANNNNRWRAFFERAFPEATKAMSKAMKAIKTGHPLPTMEQWKKNSSAGVFASRHEAIKAIDAALEHFHIVVGQESERFLPEAMNLRRAVEALGQAIDQWLTLKTDKEHSTRRESVQNLREQLAPIRANIRILEAGSNDPIADAGI